MADEEILLKRRSEGRMKTYSSAIDARAWCDKREDRRQYILDIIRRSYGRATFLPIDEIVNLLLRNEKGDCKKLQLENEELRRLLESRAIISNSAGDVGTKKEKLRTQVHKRRLSSNTFKDVNILGKISVTTSTSTLLANTKYSESGDKYPKESSTQEKMKCSSKTIQQINIRPANSSGSTSSSSLTCKEERECKAKSESIKKLVDLENQLLTKKQNTKQKMDHLKTTFCQLRKELDMEKAKNSTLMSESSEYTKAIDGLQKDIQSIKTENRKDKQKILELSVALKRVLEDKPCKCEKHSQQRRESYKLEIESQHDKKLLKESLEQIGTLQAQVKLSGELEKDLEKKLEECKSKLAQKERSYEELLKKYQSDQEYKIKVEELATKALKNKDEIKNKINETRTSLNSIVEKVSNYEKLKLEHENLLKNFQRLEKELKEEKAKSEEVAPLKCELKKACGTIKSLKEEKKPVEEENISLRKLSAHIQDCAKRQLSKLEVEKNDYRKRSEQFEQLYSDLKNKQDVKDNKTSELEAQLKAVKDDLEKEKASATKCKAQLTEYYQQKEEIVKLKQEIEKLNKEINKQKSLYESDLNRSNSKLLEMKSTISNLQQNKESSLKEIKKLEQRHSEQISSLQKINENLKAEASNVAVQEKDAVAKLQSENKSLKNKIGGLTNDLGNLQKKMDMAVRARDNLLKEIDDGKLGKEKECLAYKKQIDILQKEKDCLKSSTEALNQELKDLKESTRRDVEEVCGEMQKTINELAQQLQAEEKQVCCLTVALEKANAEKDSQELLRMIERLEIENSKLKEQRPSSIPRKCYNNGQKPSRLPIPKNCKYSGNLNTDSVKEVTSIDSYSTESSIVTHKHEPKRICKCVHKRVETKLVCLNKNCKYYDQKSGSDADTDTSTKAIEDIKKSLVCSKSPASPKSETAKSRKKSCDRSSCRRPKTEVLNKQKQSSPRVSLENDVEDRPKVEVLVKKDPKTPRNCSQVSNKDGCSNIQILFGKKPTQFHSVSENLTECQVAVNQDDSPVSERKEIVRRSCGPSNCPKRSISDISEQNRTHLTCVKEFRGIKVKVDVIKEDKKRVQAMNENLKRMLSVTNNQGDKCKCKLSHVSTEVTVVTRPRVEDSKRNNGGCHCGSGQGENINTDIET